MRRAISAFPIKEISQRVLDKYFVEGGIGDEPYKSVPMYTLKPQKELVELVVLANFVETFLAKEGHDGIIGSNLLEKIQMPTVHALFGLMLADIDYVIVGAGIPREIPGILDKLSNLEDVKFKINVEGSNEQEFLHFSPKEFLKGFDVKLKRPKFLAIVSSNVLATTLVKKSTGKIDGIIIENHKAGGHNAPPRVKNIFNEADEPVYSSKDFVNIEKIKQLGVPFWLAGCYGTKDGLKEALELGAKGIQVGTAFAFTEESGFTKDIKINLIEKAKKGIGKVFTDRLASPTGFPFKVVSLENSLSEFQEYIKRKRVCNIGCLRQLFKKEDGSTGYKCPAEPVDAYVKKGGNEEDTKGRKCLCNALLANIGLPSRYKDGYVEQTLITAGECFNKIKDFLKNEDDISYFVADVIESILPTKKI
jgi:nitronate monooxygenase